MCIDFQDDTAQNLPVKALTNICDAVDAVEKWLKENGY